jgi:PAS domain S-box-containing protein
MLKNHSLLFVDSDAFKEIFESMSEGIIIVDENGKIVIANPVSEQIFGYETDGLTGIELENLLPARYRTRHINFREGFNRNPEPRRMGFGRDLKALRKDGSEFPVEISLSFTKVKGQLLVMAFISDISQRKKAEEALKRSEEQLLVYAAELERKVEARTHALNDTISRLEEEVRERKKAEEEVRKAFEREREVNDLKSKFVSIASHEFRTPLSAVLSSASLINQYKEKGELEKVSKHVARIKSSVNHLTSILNDFLSLGKLEEGKVDVNNEVIPVNDFLKEVREELLETLRPGQDIIVDERLPALEIKSDIRILRNIFFNLISNASKYSAAGKKIYMEVHQRDDQVIFDIRDEGIGIPSQDFKHMFDRFFRASNAGETQGTGLGLNIVRRYVELLDGSVAFSSRYGEGSTFSVTLPLNNTL